MNDNFFKDFSEDMAYILGYTIADGNLLYKGYGKYSGMGYILQYHIHLKDINILKYIKECLQIDNKISITKKIGSDNIYREQAHLVIHNKNLVKSLIDLSVVPNKTGKEIISNLIPIELFGHVLRGFFDGDGSITITQQTCNNKKYPYHMLRYTSASRCILQQIKDFVCNNNKIVEDISSNCYRYSIASRKEIQRVVDIMYPSNFNFCLKRKRDKLIEGNYQVNLGLYQWEE